MEKNTSALLIALLLSVFVFYYTGNREDNQVKNLTATVENQLSVLEKGLEDKTLHNAVILTSYAERLKTSKPELANLADQLAMDASNTGPTIMRFKERLLQVKDSASSSGNTQEVRAELQALQRATNLENYNDFLLSNINVIAGLSGGTLAAVKLPDNQKAAAGSQLVGNPTYGQWRQQNGMSIWEWYAAYSILQGVIGGGRNYSYNDWMSSPAYQNSYQGNKGKSVYSSGQVANDNVRKEKNYGANQERRNSSYSSGKPAARNTIWGNNNRRSSSYGFASGSRKSSSFRSFRRR